jgi:hypothetical protein
MPCLRALATITGSTTSTYLDESGGATNQLRTDAMKERGLRSRGSPSRVKTRVFQNEPPKRRGARMEREYVGIDFHRGRSVVVHVSASEERLSASRIDNTASGVGGRGHGGG